MAQTLQLSSQEKAYGKYMPMPLLLIKVTITTVIKLLLASIYWVPGTCSSYFISLTLHNNSQRIHIIGTREICVA